MVVSSDFFNRMAAYPMVTSAYQQASSCVTWAKDRSSYARSAAGLAESGLRRVAGTAEPLLNRYEERIAGLDRLACKQLLDRLETACPTVLQPTEEVMERGRGYYRDSVKPKVEFVLSPVNAAVTKAQAAKAAGLERYRQLVASQHGQAGLRQFDQLIQLLSDCVDKCLPPPPSEAADDDDGTKEKQAKSKNNDDGGDLSDDSTEEEEDAAPADPLQSLLMAYSLGRKVSGRVSHRVTDQATDLAAVAYRLVDRLMGRSKSAQSDSSAAAAASSDKPPANQEEKPQAASSSSSTDADAKSEEAHADESLNRSDMSTD